MRQKTVTACDARAFRRAEDVVEDIEHLSNHRMDVERVLHVIGTFKNILSKGKKVVALFLCAFAFLIVWLAESRLRFPTTLFSYLCKRVGDTVLFQPTLQKILIFWSPRWPKFFLLI